MYIWILLASIMVALTFFNLPPRADKENAFSEIKVATLTRRFRLEHLAFTHAFECEAVYNRGKYSREQKITSDFNVGYTSFKENLPVGYSLPEDPEKAGQPVHYVICMDNHGFSDKGSYVVGNKCRGSHIFGVSFQRIPDRWVSKQKDTDTNLYMPLPAFTNFLGTEVYGMQNTGWVYCENASKCHFAGKAGMNGRYDKEANLHIEKVTLPPDLLKNAAFKAECLTQPCLFAYDRLRVVDTIEENGNSTKKHCAKMMSNYSKQQK